MAGNDTGDGASSVVAVVPRRTKTRLGSPSSPPRTATPRPDRRRRPYLANHNAAVVVLVSHRYATVSSSDLIVVLQDGHIAEPGSHIELLHKNGIYAQEYGKQAAAYR